MRHLECPCLRPGLAAAVDAGDPRFVILWDQLRLSKQPRRLSILEFAWMQLFDGQHSLRDIQAAAMQQLDGQLLPFELFTGLVERLDESLFLESPRFRDRLTSPVREPSCIGCYEGDPKALREQLTELFAGDCGPGLPEPRPPDGRLRAALIPHIDYERGGKTFAWGFKEVAERSDAALFLIIGTSHYSAHRYTLTRKDFKTPLGIVPTDQAFIDRLVAHYGNGLFDDELCHLPEHSIELEIVFLQFLYEGKRPIRVVPLVVGSFQDSVETGSLPSFREDVGRMIEALRQTMAETPEPICTIISGDLAHVGPKFGDANPVSQPLLGMSREQDLALIERAETVDTAGYFRIIAEEADRRRICGLPPTYTVLEAVQPSRGKLLHYDQYIHPDRFESVSFASMAFYK